MGSSAVKRLGAALCLCLAGAMLSGLLLLQHHGESRAVSAVNQACGEGGSSDCETVARSPWSSVLGVPVAAFGVVFYLSLVLLLALALFASEDLRPALAGLAIVGLALGLLVDLWLLGVQAVAVRAFCSLCILTYVLSALALFALWPAWRGALAPGEVVGRTEGRLAVVGWALGTLAVAGAVVAAESTLDLRENQRRVAMFGGAPAATPSPTPAPPVTPDEPAAEEEPASEPATPPEPAEAAPDASAEEVAYWKQRADELQQTLDNPEKLNQYFAEKAQKEFEAAKAERIDVGDAPLNGPADAPVKVVAFSDFLCPFCRNLGLGLAQFIPQTGGRLAVQFMNYPLDQECNTELPRSTHPGACLLALGGICAHKQGKFEAYHDRLFATEGLRNPQVADVLRIAGEAGLNAAAVRGCLEDPDTRAVLDAQVAEGRRLGVRATPTLFVNGKKLPRVNDLAAVMDKEAQKKGFPPLAE